MEPERASGIAPPTNRGAEIPPGGAGIDWWQGSVRLPREAVQERVGGEWHARERGAYGYERGAESDRGACVYWSRERPEVHVEMRGRAVRQVEAEELRGLTKWLLDQGGGFSRWDTQATVAYELARVEDFVDAWHRGEAVSHARWWKVQGDIGSWPGTGHRTRPRDEAQPDADAAAGPGLTLYVGAPTSRRRLRVYDKGAESAGAELGTRVELQERDQAADQAAWQYAAGIEAGALLSGRLVTLVDFREPRPGHHTERRPRAAWYELVIDGAERLPPYPVASDRTPLEVLDWLTRQTAPSAAALAERGDFDVAAWLADGRERMRARHRRLVGHESA